MTRIANKTFIVIQTMMFLHNL